MDIYLYPKYLIRSLMMHGKRSFFKAGYELLYPEFSRHGMSAWQHYVLDGKRKGYGNGCHPAADRFFAEGYLEMYPDVAQCGMDPWYHYVLEGIKEGRDCGLHPKYEQFFAEGYLEMYPDVAENGMDPWHHYVLVGKTEGRDNGWHPDDDRFFAEGYLEMYQDVAESGIEPWHHYVMAGKKEGRDNGLHPNGETFFPEGYLVLYPDVAAGGMDPWHHYVLKGKSEGRCDGLHPDEEQFSPACYLEMYPDVAESGMDPWIHYVLEGRKEGRPNPVSQIAPVFSPYFYQSFYPDTDQKSANPWRHFCKKIGEGEDRYPNKIVMKEKESRFIPYSCRGVQDINQDIYDDLGRFDLHTFVDFMKLNERASDAKGDPAASETCQAGGWERIAAVLVDDHIRKIVYFSHNQGGGATMYKDQKVHEYTSQGCLVLTVIYEPADSDFILYINTGKGCCAFDHADLRLLIKLGLRSVETIFINSLNGYPKDGEYAYSVADLIIDLKKSTGARLVFLCHDFEFVCPRINCLNEENKFCGLVQSQSDCGVCASQSTCMGIAQYRTMYGRLLQSCDEYVFFSHDTQRNFSKVYRLDPDKVRVVPHSRLHEYSGSGKWAYDPDRPFARFTVLVPGVITLHKGSGYVRDFAALLDKTHPDIRIVVMGSYTETELTPNIVVTGPYDSARLPELMRIFEPNCAVFPSICPETFSYTVHELMEFGLPVISFNIGAQAEALKTYTRGIVLPQMSAECLHQAIARLYDLSCPHKLSNCLEQYSVTFDELQFFNSRRGNTPAADSGARVNICISVANEEDDYESILNWLLNLPVAGRGSLSLRISFLVNEKIIDGFRESESVRNYSGMDAEIIPTNGCGALNLMRDSHPDGTVVYIEAFSKDVSELEKYYILTSVFGKSCERIAEINKAVSGQDTIVYFDNFYHVTDKAVEARNKQNDSYLQARRAYLAHGSFELFLDRSDTRICSYRNVLAFSSGLLSEVSDMIQDKRFFTDCPDSVIFDLSLNDLSLRSRYRYLKLMPEKVAKEHLSSQRELFRHMALVNFNPDFYLEKYDDVRNSGDPLAHFLGHGFNENRLYADSISDEWLSVHCGGADEKEKSYLKSYKSYAEARYIYEMPLADFRKYVGGPGHYIESPSDCLSAETDFSSIKVSFIVPVYNSGKFLRHCLDSIYNVDYPDFEVILVDDGSKDNSVEIINEYKERYSSITKVIIHQENLCFAATHKDGINAATGKYFSIVDADDYISEDYAKVFVAFAEFCHLDMAVCDWTRPKAVTGFYAKNRYLIDPVVATAGELQDSFGNWNNPLIPSVHYGLNRKLYNRESFIRANPITIDPDYAYNEDFSVTFKLSENRDWNIGLIKNRLYGWFDNPGSVSYCDMTEKAIVHFVYTFFVDLKEFMQNKKYTERMIACCRKQLYEKLEHIENKALLKKRLEFLASQFDLHTDLFKSLPYMLNNYLKGMFNHLYFRTIKSVLPEYRKVCVLDTVGHYELKKFLLPKLRQEKTDFYYASCSPDESFAAMMDKLKKVNECCLIITDGGWAWSEMVTDLPIINTWHGMGALKYTSLFPQHLQPEIGFSSGKDVNFCYRWFFNLPDNRIIPNGNLLASRYLYADFRAECREQFFSKYPQFRNKRIYLYAPTFRGYEPNFSTMKPGYDWGRVSELLDDDEVIFVKWHPCLKFFSPEVLPDLSKFKNIIDVTDYDLSEVLLSSSVLLTDYSSVIFYAAVIDLPIGVLATDIDAYSSNRGFFIDYRNEAPCEPFEETDEAKLIAYIRSRRSDTRKYQEFKKKHVGGVTDNVDEILFGLIKKYLKGKLSLY